MLDRTSAAPVGTQLREAATWEAANELSVNAETDHEEELRGYDPVFPPRFRPSCTIPAPSRFQSTKPSQGEFGHGSQQRFQITTSSLRFVLASTY